MAKMKKAVHDRALLLYGAKRNAVLSLAEIEQYGMESFADAEYISVYGMPPREWYRHGVRLLGRTAVECTRDALGARIARDVASVAVGMSGNEFEVIDPFAGSCNTLFWILRHLSNSIGIAFEFDQQVFELTHHNLEALRHRIKLVYGNYVDLLKECRVQEGSSIVVFVAPPWGTALDEVQGLDLSSTIPPIIEVIDEFLCRYPENRMLFAVQIYEKVSASSLNEIQKHLDWTELRIYDINERGRNHGILMGTKGWAPH